MRAEAEPLPDDPDNRDEDDIQVKGVTYAPKVSDFAVWLLRKRHDTFIPVPRPPRRCSGLYCEGQSLIMTVCFNST
jgi:hypothetical protein